MAAVQRLAVEGSVEGCGCAGDDFEGHLSWQAQVLLAAVPHQRLQVDALKVFHDDRALAIDRREILDSNNVSVMEQAQYTGFIPGALNDFFMPNPLPVEELDGDDRFEVVPGDHLREVHLPKGTLSEFLHYAKSTTGLHSTSAWDSHLYTIPGRRGS